jgi:hypothetical protein
MSKVRQGRGVPEAELLARAVDSSEASAGLLLYFL